MEVGHSTPFALLRECKQGVQHYFYIVDRDEYCARYTLIDDGVISDTQLPIPFREIGTEYLYDTTDFNNFFNGGNFHRINGRKLGRKRKFRYGGNSVLDTEKDDEKVFEAKEKELAEIAAEEMGFDDECGAYIAAPLPSAPPAPTEDEFELPPIPPPPPVVPGHVNLNALPPVVPPRPMGYVPVPAVAPVVPNRPVVATLHINAFNVGRLRSKIRLEREGNRVYIDYEGKQNGVDYNYFGTLPVMYPGFVQWQTDDGIIVRSVGARHLSKTELKELIDLDYRVEEVAKSLAATIATWGVSASVLRASRALKAQYRRFYGLSIHDEKYIEMYATSLKWMCYVKRDYKTYAEGHFKALKNAIGAQGVAPEYLDLKVKKKYFWRRLRYKCRKYVTYGVSTLLLPGLGTYLAHRWWEENKCVLKPNMEQCKMDVVREKRDTVISNAVGMIPCSKLILEHTIASLDRPMNSINKVVDYDSTDERTDHKTTDIYGATIDYPCIYPSNKVQNMDVGLSTRMGFSPTPGQERALDEVIDVMHELDKEFGVIQINDTGFQQFLRSQYGPKRFDDLMELRDSTIEARDYTTSMHIKNEIYVGKEYDNFRPRMIWGVNEKFTAKYGNLVHKITEHMKDKWHVNHHNYFVCGATPDQLGEFVDRESKKHKYMVMWDSSAFSGHLYQKIVREENSFFGNIDGMPSDYKYHMDKLDSNGLKGKYKKGSEFLRVFLKHGGPDGKLTTCARNTRWNIAMIRWLLGDITENTAVMALGDDGVAFTDNVPRDLEAKAKSIGFDVEFKVVQEADELEFCSGFFVTVGGRLRYVNKPMRCLMKFGVNYNNHPPKLWNRLLYGIAKGMLPTAGHSPVFGAMLRAIINDAERLGLKPYYDLKHMNPYRVQGGVVMEPDMDTYDWFAKKYQISPELLIEIDRWMLENITLEAFPAYFDGEVIRQMAKLETASLEQEFADAEMRNEFLRPTAITSLLLSRSPVVEELEKLSQAVGDDGRVQLFKLLKVAWEFGKDEDEMAGTNSHKWLHMLFSFVTFLNFDKGVALHANYNAWAMAHNLNPCTKKKKKAPVEMKTPQTNPQKRVTEIIQVPTPNKQKLLLNEIVYQAALKDPWNAPDDVRIPDADATETATISGKGRGSYGVQIGSTSGYANGLMVFPYCGDSGVTPKVYTISALVSITSVTWSTLSGSYGDEETILASEAVKLRTVCMGVIFRCNSRRDELNGEYYVGWVRKSDIDAGFCNNLEDLAVSKDMRQYSATELEKGVAVTWKPGSYNTYDVAATENVPAACWHQQTMAFANWDDGEIVPVAFGTYANGTAPRLLVEYLTRYEYMPVSADYQVTPTAATLGSQEARMETMTSVPPSRGPIKSVKDLAWKGLKAALKNDRVNSALAQGTKMLLPNSVVKGMKLIPKPIKQIASKIPLFGGYFSNLFGLTARRMCVALGLRTHDANVERMTEALMHYHKEFEILPLLKTIEELHTEAKLTKTFRAPLTTSRR